MVGPHRPNTMSRPDSAASTEAGATAARATEPPLPTDDHLAIYDGRATTPPGEQVDPQA